MLVVKVELWPGGDEKRAREIGAMALANVSDLSHVSDYVVVSRTDRGQDGETLVTGHRRSVGFWPLIARAAAALTDATGERVPPALAGSVEELRTVLRVRSMRTAVRRAVESGRLR